ncbi:sporulation protein Cse60 [Paenibacillus graminis]|nr:sporulation protein Cse60 [Paenibacillus graminis]
MMNKVKIYHNIYAEPLESEINEFINGDEVETVLDIKFSTAAIAMPDDRGIVDPLPLYSALVYYQQKANKPIDGSHPAFGRG